MKRISKNLIFATLLVAVAMLSSSCGSAEDKQNVTTTTLQAKTGANTFSFSLAPNVIPAGGIVNVRVQVWNTATGTGVDGVSVALGGESSSTTLTTANGGVATTTYTTSGSGGDINYPAITVGGVTLTIPVQLVP